MPCVLSLGAGSLATGECEPGGGTQGEETPRHRWAQVGAGATRCGAPVQRLTTRSWGVLSSPRQPNAEGPVYPSLPQLLPAALFKGLVASNSGGEKCLGL